MHTYPNKSLNTGREKLQKRIKKQGCFFGSRISRFLNFPPLFIKIAQISVPYQPILSTVSYKPILSVPQMLFLLFINYFLFRIVISNLHKETKKNFSDVITDLYKMTRYGRPTPMISEQHYKIIMENADRLNSAIVFNRDFNYQYFGFKTLERSYLLKIDGRVVERPQHMLMRVSVGIHGDDIDGAIETYNMMSEKLFTHASPTLFNAATPRPQLSSCFLLTMSGDSIEDIYDTLKRCALISKSAGGIGLNVHCIRATGSYIAGTNGISNGLVPMLRVFNNTARYVDQVMPNLFQLNDFCPSA